MAKAKKQFQLVTRSDMDGLVCAVLLKEKGLINQIKFAHPKDVQDGKIQLTENDITTNLPYVESVHLAFDHHASETIRVQKKKSNYIVDAKAPSAASVVYKHFGGKKGFPKVPSAMMTAVDKADSANYKMKDILEPGGWELLSFLMDARTGLGRFKTFKISNYDLMMNLIDYCRDHTIKEILALPDVKERVDLFLEHQDKFRAQIRRCTTVHKNLAVLDLRNEETIYAGNRFMIYALYPECDLSMHVIWGLQKQNTSFAVGRSILKRTATVNVGALMLVHGGGGHEGAGTCQVDNDKAEATKQRLIERLTVAA